MYEPNSEKSVALVIGFELLTEEILLKVFLYLDLESLLNLRHVNQRIRTLVLRLFNSEYFHRNWSLPNTINPFLMDLSRSIQTNTAPRIPKNFAFIEHKAISQCSQLDFVSFLERFPECAGIVELSPILKLKRTKIFHKVIQVILHKIHEEDKQTITSKLAPFFKKYPDSFSNSDIKERARKSFENQGNIKNYHFKLDNKIKKFEIIRQTGRDEASKIKELMQGVFPRNQPLMLTGFVSPMIVSGDFYPWWFCHPSIPSNWSPWGENFFDYKKKIIKKILNSDLSSVQKSNLVELFLSQPKTQGFTFSSVGKLEWQQKENVKGGGSVRLIFADGDKILDLIKSKTLAEADLSYENIVVFLEILEKYSKFEEIPLLHVIMLAMKLGFSNLENIPGQQLRLFIESSFSINLPRFLKEFIFLLVSIEGTQNNIAILDGPMATDLISCGCIDLRDAFFWGHGKVPLYSMAGSGKGAGVMKSHATALETLNVDLIEENIILSREIQLHDLFFETLYPCIKNYSEEDQIVLSTLIMVNYLSRVYGLNYSEVCQIKREAMEIVKIIMEDGS